MSPIKRNPKNFNANQYKVINSQLLFSKKKANPSMALQLEARAFNFLQFHEYW